MAKQYNDTETKVMMISRNDKGDFIKVCRMSDSKGKRLDVVDIRNYYTSDQDHEVYPTQKGVRIHSEMLASTVVAILNTLTEEELEEVNKNWKGLKKS